LKAFSLVKSFCEYLSHIGLAAEQHGIRRETQNSFKREFKNIKKQTCSFVNWYQHGYQVNFAFEVINHGKKLNKQLDATNTYLSHAQHQSGPRERMNYQPTPS